ncbi:MAG: ABC transporter ATP-binding protein [Anaerolineae bacterium]|nr:ABC transporter ATP-binding protein [Thermoflexales bacterium]MDW8407921.1 ABC transporter ATP-binding protein [Anaerolineae bacterium]
MPEFITLHQITKTFPPNVVALDGVSVSFEAGEIHAVVGENGAGKSTLMKVLYGLYRPDRGQILLGNQSVRFHSANDAIAAGVGMVHQEILLIPEYTVWQNVVLGAEPRTRWGTLDVARARGAVQAKIDAFGFNIDPDAPVGELSVAARQKVEILKLLYRDVSVLILDEPTAVLTPLEVPQLFAELRRLRAAGKTILFISHHLDEVLELSDRITVLRRGKKVDTVPAASTSKSELARMMVGRELMFTARRAAQPKGEIILRVEGVYYRDKQGVSRLRDVSLTVRAGEIVGIAGVEGNGQYELVNVLVGLEHAEAGSIFINGHDLTHASILERRRHIAFVAQDRSKLAASVSASVAENAIMTHHRLNEMFARRRWRLDMRQAGAFTEQMRKQFTVAMSRPDQPFRALSGGNQQKVILGRELLLERPFLLLDQPTRGLDVGSTEYVREQIAQQRDAGRAILLISSDLEELFSLTDRIAVMYRGAIVADVPTAQTDLEQVGAWMLQGRNQRTAQSA